MSSLLLEYSQYTYIAVKWYIIEFSHLQNKLFLKKNIFHFSRVCVKMTTCNLLYSLYYLYFMCVCVCDTGDEK